MPAPRARSLELALAALFLAVLYAALRQRTWSLDGAIHTLASRYPVDAADPGHVLLRPLAWSWTSLLAAGGALTFAQRYAWLHGLFAALGVASLVILFAVVRPRVGAFAAWTSLAAVALMRCTERQIVNFDEKPLGMFLFASAVFVTDRAFERARTQAHEPSTRDLLPMGLMWVLAVAGHMQSAPFAVASLAASLATFHGAGRLRRWGVTLLRLGPLLALAGAGLVVLLHAGAGGWAALPRLADQLFVHRLEPPAAGSLLELVKISLLGWVKAFFIVDRLSPRWASPVAAAGCLALFAAMGLGLRRHRGPLAVALVAGSVGLLLLAPAANYFPDYGDSYTMVVMAALVLLAAAPRAALAIATALVVVVNLPAAIGYSFPETTMREQLTRMVRAEGTERAVAAASTSSRIRPRAGAHTRLLLQSESLRVGTPRWRRSGRRVPARLPQPIERDGSTQPGRVETIRTAAHRRPLGGPRDCAIRCARCVRISAATASTSWWPPPSRRTRCGGVSPPSRPACRARAETRVDSPGRDA
jgi:hypothetical protein